MVSLLGCAENGGTDATELFVGGNGAADISIQTNFVDSKEFFFDLSQNDCSGTYCDVNVRACIGERTIGQLQSASQTGPVFSITITNPAGIQNSTTVSLDESSRGHCSDVEFSETQIGQYRLIATSMVEEEIYVSFLITPHSGGSSGDGDADADADADVDGLSTCFDCQDNFVVCKTLMRSDTAECQADFYACLSNLDLQPEIDCELPW